MNDSEAIKAVVREKYGSIARSSAGEARESCCGTSCCGSTNDGSYTIFSEDYTALEGYVEDADFGLGCGMPTEFAAIQPGDVVLDLGSGAGNDVFIAQALVGAEGRVVGVDMTPEMVDRANENARKLGIRNVSFLRGEIENLPVADGSIDVIISNCVLNLVPDKQRAFAEIFRVLKPGGHFCISDIVTSGPLTESVRRAAELHAGCVAGALEQGVYLDLVAAAGFQSIEVARQRTVDVPDDVYLASISPEELTTFKAGGTEMRSITVTGYRP